MNASKCVCVLYPKKENLFNVSHFQRLRAINKMFVVDLLRLMHVIFIITIIVITGILQAIYIAMILMCVPLENFTTTTIKLLSLAYTICVLQHIVSHSLFFSFNLWSWKAGRHLKFEIGDGGNVTCFLHFDCVLVFFRLNFGVCRVVVFNIVTSRSSSHCSHIFVEKGCFSVIFFSLFLLSVALFLLL